MTTEPYDEIRTAVKHLSADRYAERIHPCGCRELRRRADRELVQADPCLPHRRVVIALMRAEFTSAQAWALTTSNPDTVFLVMVGAA